MARALSTVFSLLALTLTLACIPAQSFAAQPGDLVSATLVLTYTPAQLNQLRDQLGLGAVLPDTALTVQEYVVLYNTVTETGAPTVASGMLLLPSGAAPQSFPILSVQRGTSSRRTDTSSNPKYTETMLSALVYAAHGFLTSMPDYLGMGASLQGHPYLHAQTEASAARDMIAAVRHYSAQNNIKLTDELYLAGYSQGGHATMALHRLFQAERVAVTASIPMAGPYDLSHTSMRGALGSPTTSSSGYVAFCAVAMNRIYHVMDRLSDAFVPGVASIVEGLFDGTHTLGDVAAKLPGQPTDMLTPEYREAITTSNPNNKLVQALEQNDDYDWTPTAPVYLFHASGDHDVPYHNSELVYALFKSRGVQVQLTDLGSTLGHVAAAGNAYVLSYQTLAMLHLKHEQGSMKPLASSSELNTLVQADLVARREKNQTRLNLVPSLSGMGYLPGL